MYIHPKQAENAEKLLLNRNFCWPLKTPKGNQDFCIFIYSVSSGGGGVVSEQNLQSLINSSYLYVYHP